MVYPSLLYCKRPEKKQIPLSVFEDLQLIHFFDSGIIGDVRFPCDRENREARQGLFTSLSDAGNFARIKELYDTSELLAEADERYSELKSEIEKSVVFIYLMKCVSDFENKATECDFGDRQSALFSSFFKKLTGDGRHREMISELDGLWKELAEKMTFTLSVGTDSISVSPEHTGTYIEKLVSSAHLLGIEVNAGSKEKERPISTDIIEKAVSADGEYFRSVKGFYDKYRNTYDNGIVWYRNELKFYICAENLILKAKDGGVPFCFAEETDERMIVADEVYDISLLEKNEKNIVPNNADFKEGDSFFFLTGANGGGKTTFLRAVGILTLFYLLGCPLPCRRASIGGITNIFTHFPRDERFDGSGRFVEEDKRVRKIIEQSDGGSFILLNETYATTNEENAVHYTEKLASLLHGEGRFGLYITHQHGLNDLGIPYLHVVIDENDGNRRTFKIERNKSGGGSFARDILKRYGLTAEA
ncbi:MAG: hypothetical protein KBT31_05255, partial [Firmicutes bacterium]|nr:hypothetical protein [Candidatus Colimorpha enterica]